MTTKKIANRIIQKGGLLGECAKIFSTDKEKLRLFILECAEMCQTKMLRNFWGEELVEDLLECTKKQNSKNKRVNGYDLLVIRAIKFSRKAKGVKQDIVACALEMTQSNYCKLEKGLIPPTVGQLNRIAKALDISMFEILDLANSKNYAQSE